MYNVPKVLVAAHQPEADMDCACPDIPFVITGPVVQMDEDCACPDKPFDAAVASSTQKDYPSPMQIAPRLYTVALPKTFTLAFSPFAPAGPAVLNQPASRRLQEFERSQPLSQAIDHHLAACGLLVPTGQKLSLAWGKPTTLTTWLHITNACNLDCPYCYVRKSNARMSHETGFKAIRAIFQAAEINGFRAVKLKYAGGEAALHFSLVQRLHAYAQTLATERQLDLRAVVLSNGTVWTPSMAQWLVDTEVKLMISLDGVGETQDAQRPTRGKSGSFARIEYLVDNVLLRVGVRPDISITITGRNAFAAADAVAWAIERDLPFSLNFYRENLLSAKYEDLKLEEIRIIAGMREAYQVVAEYLPTRPFLGGLLDRVQMEAHAHTCGVGQSYLVFNHTGEVAQCQMHLGNSKAISDTEDVLDIVAHGTIPVISVDNKEGCRDCTWRYRCAGGCPLETYRATGQFDVQSPHCNIYTTLFPEALRLEGLRLLKTEGHLN